MPLPEAASAPRAGDTGWSLIPVNGPLKASLPAHRPAIAERGARSGHSRPRIAAPATQRSCHAWNIRRLQIWLLQLREPRRCSCHVRRIGSACRKPSVRPGAVRRAGPRPSRAAARAASRPAGLRSPASAARPAPPAGSGWNSWRSSRLPGPACELRLERQLPGELDDAMVEEGHAGFQADRHAGAVDLGQDVVGQIASPRRKYIMRSAYSVSRGRRAGSVNAVGRLVRRRRPARTARRRR